MPTPKSRAVPGLRERASAASNLSGLEIFIALGHTAHCPQN